MLPVSPTARFCAAATAALSLFLVSCGKDKPAAPQTQTDTAEAAPDLPPPPPAPGPSPLLASTSVFEREFGDTPVNWRLWNDESFALAAKHRRPIFLLIGYSVCPWCAKMKADVFSNPEIASFINENFLPVVVDAELYPEVNRTFMAYVQASKGISGWPLNIFLTPGGAPLSAGSYMTATSTPGNPGFLDVAKHISAQWKQFPEHYAEQALRDLKPLIEFYGKKDSELLVRPSAEMISSAVASLAADFDPLSGGFNSQPKFVFPPRLEFLLAHAKSPSTDDFGKERVVGMVTTTLDKVALSATHDILSGGFFRYSTDSYWNSPNFEKHLSDQALNSAVYTAAYEASGNELYREVVYETFRFMDDTFAAPSGTYYNSQATGFAVAENGSAATSQIGSFYTWTQEEIQNAIGKDRSAAFAKAFGIKIRGNMRASSSLHSELGGRNVLIPRAASATKEFAEDIRLLAASRATRQQPLIDKTIALVPNAYAALAYARAGRVFEDPTLTARAEKILAGLRETHCDGGSIPSARNTLDDAKGLTAIAEDYAAIVAAYLEMYKTTQAPEWLEAATVVQDAQTQKFYDRNARGFFPTQTQDNLFMRIKPLLDASSPSVNSLSVLNLITIADSTGDKKYRTQAWETLYGLSPYYAKSVGGSATMIQALGVLLDSGKPGE